MARPFVVVWLAVAASAALVQTPSALPVRAAAGPIHIHALTGSIEQIGAYRGGGSRILLYGVRLTATVCLRSPAEALKTYPDEFWITHFDVTRNRRRWWAMRKVRDNPHWMVPFGETWRGRACGSVVVRDPIPESHANLHSLGNPRSCYGVELGISVGDRLARRRAIVKCGPRFGA